MSRLTKSLLLGSVVFGLFACSGGSSETDHGAAGSAGAGGGAGASGSGGASGSAAAEPGPDTLAGFCQALAERTCELIAPCCDAPGFDGALCVRTGSSGCESEYGAGAYDSLLAGQCLQALSTLADCGYGQDTLAPCRELARPRIAPGGACNVDLDCLHSETQAAACTDSVCVLVPYLKSGAVCSDPALGQCGPGLACVQGWEMTPGGMLQKKDPTCEPLLALGVSCKNGTCASGYCDMTSDQCAEIPANSLCAKGSP